MFYRNSSCGGGIYRRNFLKHTSLLFAGALALLMLIFTGCKADVSGIGGGGGSADEPPAMEMKTGPEIQTELKKIGFKTALHFTSSSTPPSNSLLLEAQSNPSANKIVILSKDYTIDEYIDKLFSGEKPAVCLAWNEDNVIYYFANGYTDKGKKIRLNPDSSGMFYLGAGLGNPAITQIDLDGFDTSNVTNMSHMFQSVSDVKTLDLTGFNVKKVTDTTSMFESCYYLERIYVKPGTDWSTSANVTNSTKMFFNSPYLKSAPNGKQDVGTSGKGIEYARIYGLGGNNKGYFTDINTKPAMNKIELNTTSVVKEYFRGATLNTSGLIVTVCYKDANGTESSKTITTGFETSYDFSEAGQTDVTISYTENGITKSAKYTVTIKDGYTIKVKHMQENLADSNYTLANEEEFGFSPGTSFTPTAKSYEDFEAPTGISTFTVNENKTIELKYARKTCIILFTAESTDGTKLKFDKSYESNISSLPGLVGYVMQTFADSALPRLSVKVKCGTDLSKLTHEYYLNAKGYKFSSVKKPSGYTDSSNLDANNYPKKAKENCDKKTWTTKWRLPTIYICDQDHGNNLSYYLKQIGADKSAVKFIPSATPKPSTVSASQVVQISTDYLPPSYNTRAEAKAYAWVEMVGSTPVIKYYAECGNASNDEGYPLLPYTDCRYMFTDCKNLQEIDLSGFDLSNATNMSYMFNKCTALKTVKFDKVDTSKVTTMREMFMECENLTKFDYSGFVKSACTDMYCMFYQCKKLSSVTTTSWNTSNVTTMEALFYECENLTTLDLSMFDMTNVTNIRWMFVRCTDLTTIYAKSGTNWGTKTWSGTDAEAPFSGCNKLKGSQGTTYDNSVAGGSVARAKIDGGTSSPGYFTAK